MLVQALLFAVVMVCAIAVQAASGNYQFEPLLYLKAFFGIEWMEACLLCVLAVTVHVLVNHKYLGHFVLADVYSRMGRPQDAAREAAAGRRLAG